MKSLNKTITIQVDEDVLELIRKEPQENISTKLNEILREGLQRTYQREDFVKHYNEFFNSLTEEEIKMLETEYDEDLEDWY